MAKVRKIKVVAAGWCCQSLRRKQGYGTKLSSRQSLLMWLKAATKTSSMSTAFSMKASLLKWWRQPIILTLCCWKWDFYLTQIGTLWRCAKYFVKAVKKRKRGHFYGYMLIKLKQWYSTKYSSWKMVYIEIQTDKTSFGKNALASFAHTQFWLRSLLHL